MKIRARLKQTIEKAKFNRAHKSVVGGIPPELREAHRHCTMNREEIAKSTTCGCFYCLQILDSSNVVSWVDDGKTALCPNCSIDSVIADTAGYELNTAFLEEMHRYWF